MSLADYLAKKYLTADSEAHKKSKKRRRKDGAHPNLVIADADALDWVAKTTVGIDEGPLNVDAHSAEFRKAKKNNWQTVGSIAPSSVDQAAADAIVAATAAENRSRVQEEDETPALNDAGQRMESGARPGLQTAAQVTAQLKRKQEAERNHFFGEEMMRGGKGEETIYRDASGRIINVAMKRAEARRRIEEEVARAAAEADAQKGDVQRAEREKRRTALKEARFMPVARYADDVELNEEMKDKERWDDPAAQFITTKKGGKSATGKPLYSGSSMPNRYSIRPGHRWDGVDRGNGFEKEYFAARNRRRDLKELDYAWQMDE